MISKYTIKCDKYLQKICQFQIIIISIMLIKSLHIDKYSKIITEILQIYK